MLRLEEKKCAYPAGPYSAVSGVCYTAMNICYMAGYLVIKRNLFNIT